MRRTLTMLKALARPRMHRVPRYLSLSPQRAIGYSRLTPFVAGARSCSQMTTRHRSPSKRRTTVKPGRMNRQAGLRPV